MIYTKNNSGPSIESWGTSALTSGESEAHPFLKTLCFQFLRKLHKRLVNYQIYHLLLILKSEPHAEPCQMPLIYLFPVMVVVADI